MKISSMLIAKLLTLCGISLTCTACYGVPGNTYMVKIEGMVVADRTGAPIEGIKVRVESSGDGYNGNGRVTRSNGEGKYSLQKGAWPPATITITAEDVDGAENGGEFATQTKQIELRESDYSKNGREDSYDTVYEALKTVNFILEPVDSDKSGDDEK